MKFNESEKLQIAVAYATSKACNTPEDFISNVNNMLDELSPKNWYSKKSILAWNQLRLTQMLSLYSIIPLQTH